MASDLLPEATLDGEYGVWWDGSSHIMSLEGILDSLRNDKPGDKNHVFWVEVPGEARVVSVMEVEAFQPVLAERDLARCQQTIRQNRPLALILLALAVPLLFLRLPGLTFLPAMYAVQSSSAWLEAWILKRRLERSPEEYFSRQAQEARHLFWSLRIPSRSLWRTYGMTGTWLALFVLQLVVGLEHSVDQAALVKPLVRSGQYGRLLSGAMLHGSLMHVLMNAFAAYSFGLTLERTGHRHLVVPVWLAGALGGSLASLLLMPQSTSVGASGGIMALLGFLAVMAWRRREQLPPDFGRNLLHSLVIIGAMGILAWGIIDNAAHVGGLVMGAAIAWILFRRRGPLPLEDTGWISFVGWTAVVLFLALTAYTVLRLI